MPAEEFCACSFGIISLILRKLHQLEHTSSNSGYLQIVLLLIFLVPAVLFLLSQQNTLRIIRGENRSMHPGLVWLQLIPIFGQIWQFFVVTRIANSIQRELASRRDDSIMGLPDASAVEELGKQPTFWIGIAYCILYTVGIFLNLFSPAEVRIRDPQILPFIIAPLLSLAGMICWIIYWALLVRDKRKLGIRPLRNALLGP
jgi:hypothetical protein